MLVGHGNWKWEETTLSDEVGEWYWVDRWDRASPDWPGEHELEHQKASRCDSPNGTVWLVYEEIMCFEGLKNCRYHRWVLPPSMSADAGNSQRLHQRHPCPHYCEDGRQLRPLPLRNDRGKIHHSHHWNRTVAEVVEWHSVLRYKRWGSRNRMCRTIREPELAASEPCLC